MPVSLSDFATKIAAQVGASGAIFRTTVNPDGSLQVLRSASGVAGVSGGPSSPWTILYNRVVYDVSFDRVTVSDGPGNDTNLATSPAAAFINGLN
jgi:hypothetical protein